MADHIPGPLVDPLLLPGWMRTLVARTGELERGHFGWVHVPPPASARPAAVLILLGEGSEGPDVLLLRRAETLNSHPGQVAFPGGAVDATDAGPVDASLREAAEEVGVLPAGIRPVALLPELNLTFSGYRVTPVIAQWREPSPVRVVDPAETAAVARVPVSWLVDPAHRINVVLGGDRGHAPAFVVPGMLVWGFTGMLLSGLLDLAGWSQEWDTGTVLTLDEAWQATESGPDVCFSDSPTTERGDA